MPNEFEIVVSDENLTPVSQLTGVDLKQLKKSVSAKGLRGTDYIEIIARHEDHPVAVQIANSVSESYVSLKKRKKKETFIKFIKDLDLMIAEQSKLIAGLDGPEQEEARKALEEMEEVQSKAKADLKELPISATIHKLASLLD